MAKEYHSSGRFKKHEGEGETISVVRGADLYKPADLFIVGSMRSALNKVIVPDESTVVE